MTDVTLIRQGLEYLVKGITKKGIIWCAQNLPLGDVLINEEYIDEFEKELKEDNLDVDRIERS
jgi:hypothetical protein